LLQVEKVYSGYGALEVLHGVSLAVGAAEIVCLIGANGGGKTTLLHTISHLVPCKSGRIVFDGQDITLFPSYRIVKIGLVHIPQGREIFGPFTVDENLTIATYSKYRALGNKGREQQRKLVYELFPILFERRNQIAQTLSGGEQQMLAIARGLMAQPKLLVVDEPSLGLSPLIIEDVGRRLLQLKKEGIGILLVEQNAFFALRLANRGYVLESGYITLEGSSQELLRSERLKQLYLGEAG